MLLQPPEARFEWFLARLLALNPKIVFVKVLNKQNHSKRAFAASKKHVLNGF